mmetsp:Transcript_2069/g.4699  ORF Transcript_2069/g.4699 Transcript_2069/m.4699 type:complete len:249 (+) Transcript_2069:762-1508(+)
MGARRCVVGLCSPRCPASKRTFQQLLQLLRTAQLADMRAHNVSPISLLHDLEITGSVPQQVPHSFAGDFESSEPASDRICFASCKQILYCPSHEPSHGVALATARLPEKEECCHLPRRDMVHSWCGAAGINIVIGGSLVESFRELEAHVRDVKGSQVCFRQAVVDDHLLLLLHTHDIELPKPLLVFEQRPLPDVDSYTRRRPTVGTSWDLFLQLAPRAQSFKVDRLVALSQLPLVEHLPRHILGRLSS